MDEWSIFRPVCLTSTVSERVNCLDLQPLPLDSGRVTRTLASHRGIVFCSQIVFF